MGSQGRLNRFHRDRDPWENPNGLVACRYAVVEDVDNEQLVEHAKKVTHDLVIADTGLRRLTGVRWSIKPASEWPEVEAALSSPHSWAPGSDPNAVEDMKAKLRAWPAGALVIAMVCVTQATHQAHLS